MTKLKRTTIQLISLFGAMGFAAGVGLSGFHRVESEAKTSSLIRKYDGKVNTNIEDYYDKSVVQKLPETVAKNEEISVIVTMSTPSVMDAYEEADAAMPLTDYILTKEGKKVAAAVSAEQKQLVGKLRRSGIDYRLGASYNTILSGFEITLKAKDFEKLNEVMGEDASLIVGDVYEPADYKVVTNEVDVYETGIFKNDGSKYKGDGVVVAVLDTGLDYTHSAFSVDNFKTDTKDLAFTLDSVKGKVAQTAAAGFTSGLTGEDVYVNRKVPYAYDYADKDPDVLPINSEHGTHVAGVIAGQDDRITGVAPNAQLAIMKVFSDTTQGAKSSWLLAALEDCVTLGVDVINMSLGSSCGFTRPVDDEKVTKIYDKIRDAGISLVVAASNDYNATFGSEKNGSLGLTSNPDSGTVGSPSTYEGALSVASVNGVKTPYLLYNDQIIYFTEAATSNAKNKSFVDDILKTRGENVQSADFEYVTIPGIGRSSDYSQPKEYYQGKIVLVKRGTTTFEEKVRIALKEKGAAGVIIYNNISGTISMSVGANIGAVCSIAQDEGELLAASETGILRVSRNQVAGPFMSDFSSWGPTSDLKIKPEITAHGGEILSAIPGQDYDRLSGTSMACPNQAGATALIRQYVKYSGVFGDYGMDLTSAQAKEVNGLVNRLMMSTADIVKNKNELPYSVRKQGAGLVNISKAASATTYIGTYDEDGKLMDKSKLELGDDKEKTGVYTMTFDIVNVGNSAVSYDVSSKIQTEGVSKTYTSHSDTTVTQDGRTLDAATAVTAVTGGTQDGNKVTVAAKSTAKVTVVITLSDADKKYLDESFKHGMYVEGFIILDAPDGGMDMNVPMLAFYGDWTEAPIFDEEYYDTHKDEINAGLDVEDKLMADAYATRVIGGLYSDYITTLGAYSFTQDPRATQVAASKEKIAMSNYKNEEDSAVTEIYSIWAGLLRNVKELNISVVEDSTGKEIYSHTEYDQRKSYSRGTTVYQSSIDMDDDKTPFSTLAYNLKNNTKYTVTVTTYIDYGEKSEQKNTRNVFTFPLYIDFEAPIVTDVAYYTEYDENTKKTKLFADLSIYDNHYAMAVHFGQIVPETDPLSQYRVRMQSFGKYLTPVQSSYNSTSVVTVELTDYVAQIKESAGIKYNEDGSAELVYNTNSFIALCYDYAMNSAQYEIRLPDEILAMNFNEPKIELNPNETREAVELLEVFPATSWLEILNYESSDPDVAEIVNNTLLAKKSGTAIITAFGYDADGKRTEAKLEVKVLGEGDEGYIGDYTLSPVSNFKVTGYQTNKAYYDVSFSERDIGETGKHYDFGRELELSMYPSESVTLSYLLESYYADRTAVVFETGNEEIATVDKDGTIVALAEGNTNVSLIVTFDGEDTLYSERISITVKDPYDTSTNYYLMNYRGLGGVVRIPEDRGFTEIYTYAFSSYEYVEKDPKQGDVIDEEDPYHIKQSALGENTITEVYIPEGVTTIQDYAFAKLTALETVHLPTTLTKIGVGAFQGCTKLKNVNFENVKFINERAFSGCALETVNLKSIVAIGNYSFEHCRINYLELPRSSQSLGVGAFYHNDYLTSVKFNASKIKIGSRAFEECGKLAAIDINAAVIASYAFKNCGSLTNARLGADVSVIGEYAFAGTKIARFELAAGSSFKTEAGGAQILKDNELVLVAPEYPGNEITTQATSISSSAFAGNIKLFRVTANEARSVGAYAFAGCTNLSRISLDKIEVIGEHAFEDTKITVTPNLSNIHVIGDYAFAGTSIESVTIASDSTIGNYAFSNCRSLRSVTLGDRVTVGTGAFYSEISVVNFMDNLNIAGLVIQQYYTPYNYEVKDAAGNIVERYTYYRYNLKGSARSRLSTLVIGENAVIGDYAFAGNAALETFTLGENAVIGSHAFFDNLSLKTVDLSRAKSIGEYAFSGSSIQEACRVENNWTFAYERVYENGAVRIKDYKFTDFSSAIETVDLTNAETIGSYAFAKNTDLKNLTFGGKVKSISDHAFDGCSALESVDLPLSVTRVGDYAFYGTSPKTVNLSNLSAIGAYAFADTSLESVELSGNVVIGAGAFSGAKQLKSVSNLDKAISIGAYAFADTSIEKANLQNAQVVGDFAFSGSAIQEVAFGDKLLLLGENPFYGTEISSFGRWTDLMFKDEPVRKIFEETYDVSDFVKVIDGVLYQSVPAGLELVSYPMNKADAAYTVEEGTTRISAGAFAGANLQSVILPTTLKAIGDKAFYACDSLGVVVFRSHVAPILEEEFDSSYAMADDRLPMTGNIGGVQGLGISKYYMWNATTNTTNFYYGSNFVDRIGHIKTPLTMVKPSNGQNYDSFIFSQYFTAKTDGAVVAVEDTLYAIRLIEQLPEPRYITLADEEAVIKARAAYDKIPSLEQQALVADYNGVNLYEKLTEAEYMIQRFKPIPDSTDSSSSEEETGGCGGCGSALGFGCAVTVIGAYLVLSMAFRKKRNQ